MPDKLRKFAPHYPILIGLLGIIFMLGAVSCRAQVEPEPVPTQAESTVEIEASPEPTVETEQDEQLAAASAEEVDQCLVCHTDQQTLEDTASPVADLESESSGEG